MPTDRNAKRRKRKNGMTHPKTQFCSKKVRHVCHSFDTSNETNRIVHVAASSTMELDTGGVFEHPRDEEKKEGRKKKIEYREMIIIVKRILLDGNRW